MNLERYISGDWGTSRLRLALCLGEHVLEARQGPGIGAPREPPAEALHRLTAGWREAHGPPPVVLSPALRTRVRRSGSGGRGKYRGRSRRGRLR